MPLNTRVGRCVTKLRNKYGYGKAIGICQHSTKQNYLTGKNRFFLYSMHLGIFLVKEMLLINQIWYNY